MSEIEGIVSIGKDSVKLRFVNGSSLNLSPADTMKDIMNFRVVTRNGF
jgi:hypothetical protein